MGGRLIHEFDLYTSKYGIAEKSKEKPATKCRKHAEQDSCLWRSPCRVCQNLPVLLQTLRWYENKDFNPTAIGLLKKMKKADFISTLFILKSVLPVLSILSKVFQKGTISYSRISPAIKASKDSLNRPVEEDSQVKEFRKETTTGNLVCLELGEDKIQETATKMHDLCLQYVSALSNNIDKRFQHYLPVVPSFRIVDPVSIPSREL